MLLNPCIDPLAGHGRGLPRVRDKYDRRGRPIEPSLSDLDYLLVSGPNEYLVDADGAILIWSA